MPNDLISTDPIVARNFYLEIDGQNLILSGVSGLEIELDVVPMQQNGKDGKQQHIKTLGGVLKAPDITVTRMAPLSANDDPLWKWFKQIRDGGMKATARAATRKNGSIVLYDSAYDEVGRFNWFNGWPSKIATDSLSTDSNEPMKETITLVVERIERVK
ncbi:MAG: phage tail protein [Actinomycetota bacterium]|nr:phage tail protein [Actinomycetota bacterium]